MSRRQAKIPIARQAAQKAGFWTKKGLGQHLLRDPKVAEDILEALDARPEEGILEIGPGLGALTESLLKTGCPVVAIEVDAKACAALRERFAGHEHFHLEQGDVLKTDLAALAGKVFRGRPFHVAANLPYYITTPVLAHVLESGLAFTRMVVLAQKEVAERLCARPGNRTYAALTVMAQFRARTEYLRRVLPGAFTPVPKVDSALVKFTRLEKPAVAVRDQDLFFKVVRSAFGKRRKTVRNALRMAHAEEFTDESLDRAFLRAGVDPKQRPEQLDMEAFARIADGIKESEE